MRTALLTALVALSAMAMAADLVVYPFDSQDPIVGAAIADRVAAALGGDVIGPAAAPALVVPLVAPSGYLNTLVFLGFDGPFDRNGAWAVRGTIGARAAVTGTVRAEGEDLRLELVLDLPERQRRVAVQGPRSDPGRIADVTAAVLAGWLGLPRTHLGDLDFRGVDGEYGRAVGLLGAGLPREALDVLDAAADRFDLPPRARSLRETLQAVVDGDPASVPGIEASAVAAVAALNLGEHALAIAGFERLADHGVPVGHAWVGTLFHNLGDMTRAAQAFDEAAASLAYPFGRAARAAFRDGIGDAAGAEADLAELVRAAEAGSLDPAAALAAAVVAQSARLQGPELALLDALGRTAPFLAYPFERRSFVAFDVDDARAAAEALAVAVELESESDLYWTNLGWALYLLDFLDRSEDASRRALELAPGQYIARYNLALVEVVTDRLDDALANYRQAIAADPTVDPEAIADLVEAEERFPRAVGVPFALGTMLEAAGERAAAADAFERYAAAAGARPGLPAADATRVREALARAEALRAPLPPIAIAGEVVLQLGRRGPAVVALRPGDPLVVRFEVVTEGDALPRTLDVEVVLEDPDGTIVAEAATTAEVPSGAIGYVVEVARLTLPEGLAAGRYAVRVRAAGEDQEASTLRTVEVQGDAQLLRTLLGRDVTMTSLVTNQPLYGAHDLPRGDAALATLVRELRDTAIDAEEVLPVPETGRFAGQGGGEIFDTSTVDDIRDFIRYLLAEGAQDTSFTFVDGYADWAVAGAPTP